MQFNPPALQNTYRHEEIISQYFGALTDKKSTELFSGSGKSLPVPPQEKGLLPEKAINETNSSGILFGALAGISGKSPGALTK